MARLIGHGPREPGTLTEHIRNRPFSVVLLDEIEKAHASFFDVLLTVLDEGRLSDVLGRTTDFRNTIVVMTSNLGAAESVTAGFVRDTPGTDREAIRRFFRPEFYNRLDQLVVFSSLEPSAVREIAQMELARLEQREGLVTQGIKLSFSDALVDHISRIGFSARYGARPLQRAIEQQVVSALSRALLDLPAPAPTRLRIEIVNHQIHVKGVGGE
ncbi:MAG: AAA family ATPase [Gammaproteobacteria bacterium]